MESVIKGSASLTGRSFRLLPNADLCRELYESVDKTFSVLYGSFVRESAFTGVRTEERLDQNGWNDRGCSHTGKTAIARSPDLDSAIGGSAATENAYHGFLNQF